MSLLRCLGLEAMLYTLHRLSDAIERVAKAIKLTLYTKQMPLTDAIGRIAASDVYALYDIPSIYRSVVDGYALRAEDTYGASQLNPIPLKVIGEASFENAANLSIGPGEAIKIHTGVPLPRGANAVVMLEDVVEEGSTIYVMKSVSVYANVSRRGEDIPRGYRVLEKGTVIEPWHIAALAALGTSSVKVFEGIRVCLIATGSELIEPGEGKDPAELLTKGKVFSSTPYLLLGEMQKYRFLEPVYMGLVEDDPCAVSLYIDRAVRECHVVITTGGTGPSQRDVVIEAVKRVGGSIVVRGIAMRPGRPTSAAVLHGKPIFMLSGFPVAAFIGLRFFVMPSLACALRFRPVRHRVYAKLVRRVANRVGYTTFVRVRLYDCEGDLCAEPIAAMGSGLISTLLKSSGILVLSDNVEGYEVGERVAIELL